MAHTLPTAASQGFANAQAYDAHRPSYPPEAVSSLLQHLGLANFEGARVVEIASGTGKFTELLAARPENYGIVAVEPLDSMRAQLVAKGLETVDVREGHAGNLSGVKDGEADGVIAAQSFHWLGLRSLYSPVRLVAHCRYTGLRTRRP
jgi:SAM-dependent methyltransferase